MTRSLNFLNFLLNIFKPFERNYKGRLKVGLEWVWNPNFRIKELNSALPEVLTIFENIVPIYGLRTIDKFENHMISRASIYGELNSLLDLNHWKEENSKFWYKANVLYSNAIRSSKDQGIHTLSYMTRRFEFSILGSSM